MKRFRKVKLLVPASVMVDLDVETEGENKGRLIAEANGLPGVTVYGKSKKAALSKVKNLATSVLKDKVREILGKPPKRGKKP